MAVIIDQYRTGSSYTWAAWKTLSSITEDTEGAYFTRSQTSGNNRAVVLRAKITPDTGTKVTGFTLHAQVELYRGTRYKVGVYAFLEDPTGKAGQAVMLMPSGYKTFAEVNATDTAAYYDWTLTGLGDITQETYVYLWFKNQASDQPDVLYLKYQGVYPSVVNEQKVAMQSTPSVLPATAAIGDTMTISTNRAGTYWHKLTYDFGTLKGQTAGLAQSTGITTGTTFTVPAALAAQLTNTTSGTITFKLRTYSDSACTKQVGTETSCTATITIPDGVGPAVSDGWATAVYYNTGTAAASISDFVAGYSKAEVTFHPEKITPAAGTSIASYKIECRGVTATAAPYRTGVLNSSAAITCTVTDSRGRSTSGTVSVTVLSYAKPELTNVTIYRSDSTGAKKGDGTYIWARATAKYSTLGGKNSVTMKGSYAAKGGSYGTQLNMTSGTGIFLASGISLASSYTAKIVLTDALGNKAEYEQTIPTDSVAFSLRPGGTGAAFGKYAETNLCLELPDNWDIKFKGQMLSEILAGMGGGPSYTDADEVLY